MKTICIYHSVDLDGWMSAAIVKHWWLSKEDNTKDRIYNLNRDTSKDWINKEEWDFEIDFRTGNRDRNRLYFLGWNYGDPIPDLSEYDKVIMCDISFPEEEILKIIRRIGNQKFVWIDHHISALKSILKSNISEKTDEEGNTYYADDNSVIAGNRATNYAACELTWKYFFPDETMPEIVRLLGRYDCFGHKGTDEEQKVLEFQYGARSVISNYEDAYEHLINNIKYGDIMCLAIQEVGNHIYQYLCTEAKQVYKNGFEIEFNQTHFHPHDGIKKFICFNKERFNPVNFGIDYHADDYDGVACFWFENGQWTFSLYNDNGEVDCSTIAKQYGGGGHKGAAGFRIDNLHKILDENN